MRQLFLLALFIYLLYLAWPRIKEQSWFLPVAEFVEEKGQVLWEKGKGLLREKLNEEG